MVSIRILLAAGLFATVVAAAADEEESSSSDEPPIDIPSENLVELQFSADPYADQDKLDMIKSGLANLAAIRYESNSFASANSRYTGVYGDFCVYDAHLNDVEPSVYPTVDDMIFTSEHCGEHTYTLPLDEVVAAVSDHDARSGQTNPSVEGLHFHAGHSGAGLLANVLASFDNTLVVPEHSAIHDALFACDQIHSRFKSADCSSAHQKQLVQDVIKLATRSPDASITHAYIKFKAEDTVYLPIVREILSDTPWTFHYRDSDTTLAKSTQNKRNTCVMSRRQPSDDLLQKAGALNIDLEGLSTEDLCALYLSTFLEAATQEHQTSGTGMLISYEQLLEPGFIADVVLPYLGLQAEIEADPAMVSANVDSTLSIKSNNRGGVKQWKADEEVIHISEKVSHASKLFMGEAMDTLRRL